MKSQEIEVADQNMICAPVFMETCPVVICTDIYSMKP